MIGTTISHYKILEKLGEGGMGIVYKAHDITLNRTVALKFLAPHALVTDEDKKRFRYEAEAAASLDHPNICTVYEFDEVDGKQFIAMAFVEGESLHQLLKPGPIKLEQAIDVAIQIAGGLSAAHKKGIVHRDIKSSNIVVTPEGQAKIMDFGLAKRSGMAQLTIAGSTVGTVPYMSPEQARGDNVDHRTDIWSLGILLYESVTGQLPFKSEYPQALIYSILNEEAPSVTSFRSNVPMELERIVKKGMQKNVADRYQHMDDLGTDLKLLKRQKESDASMQRPVAKGPTSRRRFYLYGGTAAIILFALITLDLLLPSKSNSPDDKSIAVLPFSNFSEDKESEYFSDGVTENLITDLAKIQGLRVIGRTSVFQFKSKTVEMKKVGEDLRARYIMVGSVQRSGDRLRVNAQLIDASTGYHLWADRYDRELKDLFSVQDDITSHIVSALRVTLNTGEPAAGSHTTNPDAHDLFLRGNFFMHKSDEENLRKALTFFRQALEKDPGFALPYAGIAYTYTVLADAYLSPMEAYPKVKSAALKALALDSTNADARAALAFALGAFDRDFVAADREFRRAIALNPNSVDTHLLYANFLGAQSDLQQALDEIDRAISLDPLSAAASHQKEYSLSLARRYDQVVQQHKRTVELDPDFFYLGSSTAGVYRERGMFEQAVEQYLREAEFLHGGPSPGLAITYARMGKRAEAEKILHDLEKLSKDRYVSPVGIAYIYAALAKKDLAFQWLERAYEVHDANLIELRTDSGFDPLRSDPRFAALMKKEYGSE